MTKFNTILCKLGWERYDDDVFLFVTKGTDIHGYITCAFPVSKDYEEFNEENLDEQVVYNIIYNLCSHTKFKPDASSWVIPLLISDYFSQRMDWENGLVWAKKAMESNPKLTKEQFTHKIQDKL
jgi:hypothetical protein